MSVRTPGFVGARLKEGREVRGFTVAKLAELLGVQRQAIYQYEKGISTPRHDVMLSIKNVLDLPSNFFRQSKAKQNSELVFYRSMNSTKKTTRLKARHRLEWLKEIVVYLKQFLQFPSLNLPAVDSPENPADLSLKDIEQFAIEARKFWGLGDSPISDIVLLFENNGIFVTRDWLDSEMVDAFSQSNIERNEYYVYLVSDKSSAVRSRLDACHELAHCLLHRNLDRSYFNDPKTFKLIEKQASYFAGAFLLPERSFADDIYALSLDGFLAIKPTWKVSIAAMIMRAKDLGISSETQKTHLFRNLNRRGWRYNEPLDDKIEPEKPSLLKRAFQILVDNNFQTRDEITMQLSFAPSDITSIAGLREDFFNNERKSLYVFEVPLEKKGNTQTKEVTNNIDNIIEFPDKKNR
ncbi:MAG: ImmA/IrrE family metallo-endopeptidase [Deltaproteobacteria bacterium]|nr:ImmA/IrrE family metallo-endopeptidase [Deltaproteobacteria bacterium]